MRIPLLQHPLSQRHSCSVIKDFFQQRISFLQGNQILANVRHQSINNLKALKITTDAIDFSIPDNSNTTTSENNSSVNVQNSGLAIDLSQVITHTDENAFEIPLTLRGCVSGEEMLSSGKCHECEKSTYLLVPPSKVQACKDCPSATVAECLGGSKIYPMPGYWRTSNMSENFLKCRNNEACIGRNHPHNVSTGACREGYQGVLCSDCQVGFSHTGSQFECSRCPTSSANIMRLIALALAVLVGLVIVIRSSLITDGKKKNFLPVFLRIVMNHLQLLALTSKFDLAWPQQLKQIFSVTAEPVADISTQIISIDCYLDSRIGNQNGYLSVVNPNEGAERTLFKRMIILAFSPFFVIIASIVVWNLIYLYYDYKRLRSIPPQSDLTDSATLSQVPSLDSKSQSVVQSLISKQATRELLQSRIISTIIIVLFLIHPSITQSMFMAFSCTDVDGVSRVYEDLEVVCNGDAHRLLSKSIALPAFIVWGVGIPSLGLALVVKMRKELGVNSVRERFGFLYSGYRVPQAYFWELVIMYRKIFIIFISVFLSQVGKIVQALTTLIFLVLCVSLTAFKQPFTNHFLNNLEQLSLMSSALTVYCGLFFISDNSFKDFALSEHARAALFAVILVSHILFLCYWVYHFVREMRDTVRAKMPKLYLTVFLCCNRGRMEHEREVEEYVERMGPFLGTLEKSIEYLKDKHSNYLSGSIPVEDEGLRRLLLNLDRFMKRVDTVTSLKQLPREVKVDEIVRQKTLNRIIRLRPEVGGGQQPQNNTASSQRQPLNSTKFINADLLIEENLSDSQNQNGSNTRDEFSTNIGDDSSLRSKRTFALLRESDRKPIILYEGKKDFRQISDDKVTPGTALDFNNRSQSKKTNDPDSLIDLSQTNINDSIDNEEQILFKRSGSLNSPSKPQQFSHTKRALLFGRSNSIEESPGELNDEPITERKKSNFNHLKQAVAKVTAVKTIENEYSGVMVQQKKRKEKKGHNFLQGIEKGKVRMTKERPSSKQSGNSAAQKAANEESAGNHLVLDLTDDEVEEGHSRTIQIGPQPQQRQEEGDITVENFDEMAKDFY